MLLTLCLACLLSPVHTEDSSMCLKQSGEEDWCSWSAYKCCQGYGCCGPQSTCCWREKQEDNIADGCCDATQQCCSTESSSVCCPLDSRCCSDGRGKMTCCTETTNIDKILFSITGVLVAILLVLLIYYYVIDRHDKNADICRCTKCKVSRRKEKQPYTEPSSSSDSLNQSSSKDKQPLFSRPSSDHQRSDMTLPTLDYTRTSQKPQQSNANSNIEFTETPTEDEIVMVPDRQNKYF